MENLQLAPAAGAGVGKLLADALLADPDFIPLMRDAARGGLKAMTPRRWDKDSNDWIQDEDCRVRIQTLALILAHMEGEPIKRIIHQHTGASGQLDVAGALTDSPALREAMERTLRNAKERQKKQRRVAEPAAMDID